MGAIPPVPPGLGTLHAQFRIHPPMTSPRTPSRDGKFRNRILSRMSESESAALLSELRPVELPLGMVLREPGSGDKLVYFVEERHGIGDGPRQ